MKTPFLSLCLLGMGSLIANAAFTQVWQVGDDNSGQAEFVQEDGGTNPPPGNPAGRDDDYYFAGNYSVGAVGADESWSFQERALTGTQFLAGGGDTTDRWHFNLSAANSAALSTLRVTFDLTALGYWDSSDAGVGAGGTLHDLSAFFNGVSIGSLNNVGADNNWVLTFNAGTVGATTGENVLQINRTGGLSGDAADNIGWIQYDYVRLEADAIPEPSSFAMLAAGSLGLLTLRRRRK